MVNSINKGRNFERRVLKLLSERFGIKFERVPMSGAFATIKKSNNPIFRGDVYTDNKAFNEKYNVVIECKKTKKPISILETVYLYKQIPKGRLMKWVKQCIRESGEKNFWLIFAWNKSPIFIIRGLLSKDGGSYWVSPPTLFDDVFEKGIKNRWKK